MDYTIEECEEIIANIDSKIESMTSVISGLESRREELQALMEELIDIRESPELDAIWVDEDEDDESLSGGGYR